MPNPPDPRHALAIEIARQAGQLTLEYFQDASLDVEQKEDQSPVTRADREAEQLLRSAIQDAFPEDAILGEELEDQPGSSDYQWILDPIDGTRSFISGVPLYTTLVGVLCRQEPVIGVIAAPALGELLHAASGQGTWFEQAGKAACRAQVSVAAATRACTWSRTATSQWRAMASPPAFRIASAASVAPASSTSPITTRAPAAASTSAVARPTWPSGRRGRSAAGSRPPWRSPPRS